MSRTEKHLFELALVESIKIRLILGNEAVIPGLGSFSIDHRPAIVEHPDVSPGTGAAASEHGSLSIEPPAVTVHFSPDPQPEQ